MTETLSEYRGHDRLKNRTSNIVLSAWGYEVELYENDTLVETRKGMTSLYHMLSQLQRIGL